MLTDQGTNEDLVCRFQIREDHDDYEIDDIYRWHETSIEVQDEYVVDYSNILEVTQGNYSFELQDEDLLNDFDPFFNEHVMGDEEQIDENVGDKVNSDEDDSYYIIDEDNPMHDYDIDMRHYKFNIDDDDDFVQQKDCDLGVLDNENFDSGCESDEGLGSIRKRNLKNVIRANGNDNNFFIGQMFGTKDEVKHFLKLHNVTTRRELKIVKDDKERVRVIYVGNVGETEPQKKDEKPPKKRCFLCTPTRCFPSGFPSTDRHLSPSTGATEHIAFTREEVPVRPPPIADRPLPALKWYSSWFPSGSLPLSPPNRLRPGRGSQTQGSSMVCSGGGGWVMVCSIVGG
ncbi:hypothetical protein R6Q59_030696 [Mikania micrantha]